MHSEPRKIVLAGFVVSAVAIAAYVSESGKPWLSTDEFASARGDEPVYHTRGDIMSGVVTSGPVVARGDSDATKAAGLQRNDPATAQTQLDAARSAHKDDDQARAMQREVQSQAHNAPRASAIVRTEKTPHPVLKQARTSSSPAGNERLRESRLAAREPAANSGSSRAKNQRALDTLVSHLSSDRGPGARAPATGAPAVVSLPSSIPAGLKVMQGAGSAPAAAPPSPPIQQATQKTPGVSSDSQAEQTAQAAPPPPALVVQPTSSGGTQMKTDGESKTRAQVRAEIARAREDGSLPAFGNPDPAGPAGAPSLTGAPRP